jgi:hypothetical protein
MDRLKEKEIRNEVLKEMEKQRFKSIERRKYGNSKRT